MADKDKDKDKDKKPAKGNDALRRAMNAVKKMTGQAPVKNSDKYEHVSTGSFPIDMLIGGIPGEDGQAICPGFPRRHITEIFGAESSGKTTLAISAIVQAQKAGGSAMFIDFEHALSMTYAKAQGVNPDMMLHYQPSSMEDGFKQMYIGIAAGIDIIVVDSVAAMLPKAEIDKDFDDPAKIGAVARQFSLMLPKFVMWLHKYPVLASDKDTTDPDHPGTALVFINQTRALIQTGGYGGGGGGGDENTSGGKALKFYAFLRLRAQKIKAESVKTKDPITGKDVNKAFGNVTNVKLVKTKIDGKQGHSTQMFIRFGTGIDDHYSIIETAVVQRLMKKDGAYYALQDFRVKGKDKMRKYLIENPKVYSALKLALAQAINASAKGQVKDELDEGDEIIDGMEDSELSARLDAETSAIEEAFVEDEDDSAE